jgi:hypothetical protein
MSIDFVLNKKKNDMSANHVMPYYQPYEELLILRPIDRLNPRQMRSFRSVDRRKEYFSSFSSSSPPPSHRHSSSMAFAPSNDASSSSCQAIVITIQKRRTKPVQMPFLISSNADRKQQRRSK